MNPGKGREMCLNYFILTGAMRSGQSAIADTLKSKGFHVIDEPARQILAEQTLFKGNGVPEKDASLFTELMLSRGLSNYNCCKDLNAPILFGRGVPDMIGYAALSTIDLSFAKAASDVYRYNTSVFITADWEDIYTTDDERTLSYQQAKTFGTSLRGRF